LQFTTKPHHRPPIHSPKPQTAMDFQPLLLIHLLQTRSHLTKSPTNSPITKVTSSPLQYLWRPSPMHHRSINFDPGRSFLAASPSPLKLTSKPSSIPARAPPPAKPSPIAWAPAHSTISPAPICLCLLQTNRRRLGRGSPASSQP
jgi:hypothetical protein